MKFPWVENLRWTTSLGKPGSFLTGYRSTPRAGDLVHLADQNVHSSPTAKVLTDWLEAMFYKTPRLDLK